MTEVNGEKTPAQRRDPGTRLVTWCLAVLLVMLLGSLITYPALLWKPLSYEETRDIQQAVFAQTFRVARKIYGRQTENGHKVVLLGDSRVLIPVSEADLEKKLAELRPTAHWHALNLGIFGAMVGDVEVVSRHIARLRPDLVVLAVDGPSLVPALPGWKLRNLPGQLLDIGWRDGPIPPADMIERANRWLRTLWPMYRFRDFIRAAFMDRFFPAANVDAIPWGITTSHEFFRQVHGKDSERIEAAYEAWRQEQSLSKFVGYLMTGRPGYIDWMRKRATERISLQDQELAEAILDRLLQRLSGSYSVVVLLMPRNPMLEADEKGEYQRRDEKERGDQVVIEAAKRYGVPVVDTRRSLAAEAFFDFDHIFPAISGFDSQVAQVIASAKDF